MMNKQIKLLYSVFELELSPPFVIGDRYNTKYSSYERSEVFNKFSQRIGDYYWEDKGFVTSITIDELILNRIKKAFNVDEFSNEDVFHIAKHLFNWCQNNFQIEIATVEIINSSTNKNITYLPHNK